MPGMRLSMVAMNAAFRAPSFVMIAILTAEMVHHVHRFLGFPQQESGNGALCAPFFPISCPLETKMVHHMHQS